MARKQSTKTRPSKPEDCPLDPHTSADAEPFGVTGKTVNGGRKTWRRVILSGVCALEQGLS